MLKMNYKTIRLDCKIIRKLKWKAFLLSVSILALNGWFTLLIVFFFHLKSTVCT